MAEPDLCGTVLDGRYQVIEPIAEGAMGSVYRGERLKLGRAVAIKVMHQELPDELASRQRFEREAKLMALLEHPNCVSVIDFGLHEDKPFLVMDLVRGTSLLQLLDKVGRVEVARAADIIRQVLSGLAHAHELGIVHRDIKPANIMISEKAGLGSQVRILDFGLARIMEGSTKLTTGIVVGTPNYMAPEQCKGSDVDARTDLYACGVMLFEMLTGRKPFVADDPIQVVRKHLMEKPPTLSSVVANADFGELEAVVAKALAKAPGDRYASAVDMAKAVEAAASKATKMSAAALFARAVPDNAPVGSEQATPSGWSLPADAQPSIPLSDSAILPDSAAMSPAAGDQPEPAAPPPVPTAAAATPGAAGPPPVPDAPAAAPGTAGPPPVSDAASAPSTLPPLPQAAPYVPPPPFSTGPSPVVAGSATTGPSPVVAGSATTGPSPIAAPAPGEGGAPEGSMSVPPTRPSAAAHGRITGLPLSKRQLVYAAGGVAALVVIIAIAASGGAKKSAPAKPAVVPEQIEIHPTSEGEVAEALERANALIAAESYEQAVAVLKRARKAHPDNAELAFTSGKANFGRLWWSDGIADFREAIRLDPRYRENPELLKTVLKGFITTPDADERIVGFMREIGPPLRPYLEETAEKHPRKAIRARARAELDARP